MENKKNIMKKLPYAGLVIFGITLLYVLVNFCVYGLPSFDGAMNLQVPWQMLENGKYMTTYNGGEIFDPKIQTRLPVLLPIYFVWKIFGMSIAGALAINAAYIVVLLCTSWFICKEMKMSTGVTVATVSGIVLVPQFFSWGMGIYGEIPTLALLLLSVLMMMMYANREPKTKFVVLSGVFYSLAFLNKTVILIAVPAMIVVFGAKLFFEKSIKFKTILVWIASCAVPVIIAEIYHMIQLGSVKEYLVTMKDEILAVKMQAGVSSGYEDTVNIFEKFWTHLQILSRTSPILNPWVIIVVLTAIFCIWIYRKIITKKIVYFDILILVMYSYFGWWLLITPTAKAWYRRIVMGVILLALIIGILIDRIVKKWKWNAVVSCIIGIGISLLATASVLKLMPIDKENYNNVLDTADYIKEIAEKDDTAVFYGIGWWQAPVLSVCSETKFYDINDAGMLSDNSYFVIDGYISGLAKKDIDSVFEKYNAKLCVQNGTNAVYKLEKMNEESFEFESDFTNEDLAKVQKERYSSDEDYEYITGVHGYESSGLRWCSSNVELLLRNVGNKRLHIQCSTYSIDKMNELPVKVYVLVDGKVVGTMSAIQNGGMECYIDDPEVLKEGAKDIRLFTYSKLINIADARELSYVIECIEFVE